MEKITELPGDRSLGKEVPMYGKKRFILWVTCTLGIFIAFFPLGSRTGKTPATGTNGMVVSVDRYASQVGIDILKKGGNAVDAAVAVGFALAVTYPPAGNIGGGGFMIIRMPDSGKAVALDFREMAPGKAKADMYLDERGTYVPERSLFGHLAVGVPGTVRGFETALTKYGTLDWEDVIAPAISLADKGFPLNKKMASSFNGFKSLKKRASPEFLRIFSKRDGTPFAEGDVFVQPELAESLKLIAREGPDAFYRGNIADLIQKDMAKYGGLITKQDLQDYRSILREPVRGTYRGFEIISMPPPSSGGTILIEMLNILEGYELGRMERYAPETLHLLAETMKMAYYDRARFMGDADFGEIPLERLLSKDYAAQVRGRIKPDKATPSSELGAEILTLDEAKETTHFSVIDKNGLAVSTTYTLNGGYGSLVVAEGTGILLNNEMADFNMKPGLTDDQGLIGTPPNLIAPHKRMLSSMTPAIVVHEGKIYMITGSPGGRTIINTVLNVILNVIDFKMPIQEAVDSPRMDHEWMPDLLNLERWGIADGVIESLKAIGHVFAKQGDLWSQGDAHSIWIDPQSGMFSGAADKRLEGSAVGY